MAIQMTPPESVPVVNVEPAKRDTAPLAVRDTARESGTELVLGKMIGVVSNDISAEIGMLIGSVVTIFVRQHKLGRVRGANAGYVIYGERYMPDISFVSKQRMPRPANSDWVPLAPDLAVEVLSPGDDSRDVRVKIANYLSAGSAVWLIDPGVKEVEVYMPGAPVRRLTMGETLDGGALLPGFSLPLKLIFEDADGGE
ncbi:MAG: Uma2 family endonuclease [bacterium]|nr:Uma2 family endonuclease [bacterium]